MQPDATQATEEYVEATLGKLAPGQRGMLHDFARTLCQYDRADPRIKQELETLWNTMYKNAKERGYGMREAVQIAIVCVCYVGELVRMTFAAMDEADTNVRH